MTDAGYYCLARLLARAIATRAQIHATSAQ
jgi:hypothetical protein